MSNSTLDIDLVGDEARIGDSRPEFEREADRFAVETLVPQDLVEEFIARVRPLYSKAKIRRFAEQTGVQPGIVVGQLHHRGEISYAHNREMLEKVRERSSRIWRGVLMTSEVTGLPDEPRGRPGQAGGGRRWWPASPLMQVAELLR